MSHFWLLAASAVVFLTSSISAKVILIPAQYSRIQSGISNATNGDTVLVSPGRYYENINFKGKRILVASRYLLEMNANTIRETIIDGSRPVNPDSGSVVLFCSGEDSSAVLLGFTLTNGIGTLVPGAFLGGGILVTSGSSPTLKHNIIRHNSAVTGGGIAIRYGFPRISYNAVAYNTAGKGGGMSVENGSVTVSHNVFHANSADNNGGAVAVKNAFVQFTNNAVTNNVSKNGAGLFCDGGLWSIEYCDFFHNQIGNFSGCGDSALGDNRHEVNFNFDSCDVYRNIFIDPRFTDPAAFDFSLLCSSRLVDAGATLPGSYPHGGAREDIGLFEFAYRVGDLNFDGRINLADATGLVNIIFLDAPVTCPLYAGDCDCSRFINVVDVIALINYWIGFAETPCLFTPHR